MKNETLYYDKEKLRNEFQNYSKRVAAHKNKLFYPSYATVYSWINWHTSLTLERLHKIVDQMNKEYEVDGFTIKRVRKYEVSDFLLQTIWQKNN